MTTKRCMIGLLLFTIVMGCSGLAVADDAAVALGGTAYFSALLENSTELNRGWEFVPQDRIIITKLGLADKGTVGLQSVHNLGLWEVPEEGDPTLLTPPATTITGEGSERLAPTGFVPYVYVDVDDIALEVGKRYFLHVWSPDKTDLTTAWGPGVPVTVNAPIAFGPVVANAYPEPEFSYPLPDPNPTDRDHYAVNFQWKLAPDDPVVMIGDLIDTVTEMNLQQGIDNSLDAKLDAALGALQDANENNDASAVNKLQALINEVEAQREKKLTDDQADALVAAAQAIIDLLTAP